MKKVETPHPMHDEHLCYLINMGYMESNFAEFKKLVKGAKYICKRCGRSANTDENLCRPVKL